MPTFVRRLKSWWIVSYGVFPFLLIGYIWVCISFFLNFKFQASGAVLVCAALISDLQIRRWPYITRVRYLDTDWPVPDNDPDLDAMYDLRKPSDPNHERDSLAPMIAYRVEKILFNCIILSAVLGTLIWGYAT